MATQGDFSRRDRNNNPKNTFGARSAVQIPPLTKHPPTTASCSIWGMGEGNCFQRVLDNCAISTVQPAWSAALSDPVSESVVLAIPFRTDDNPDIRAQRPVARPPINNFLRAHRWCPQVTLFKTARYQTVPPWTSPSRNGTTRCSLSFAGPPRWHSRDAWSRDTPRHGQKAWKAHGSHLDDNHESGQSSSARPLLNNLGHGGYAGIRVGEAENPRPAAHDRDWTVAGEPDASHRRINEAGDSVPTATTGRSEPAYLGLPCGTRSSASSATANNEERQKTAQTETNAQRVPSMRAVRSSRRRPLGAH